MSSQFLIAVAGLVWLVSLVTGYFVITPLFLGIHNSPQWDTIDNERADIVNERMYQIWFILFALFTGGGLLALVMRALRKDTVERDMRFD